MDALGMKGKTAVVTGAAQGIGEATALALAEQGVNVAAIDTNEDLLLGLTDRLRQKGVQAQGFAADVSDSAAVNDIIAAVERDMGPIEILANVAGVLRPGPVQSLSDEDWDQTFSVNSTGVFHVSRAVSRYMIERKKGAIVTVGSNAAGVPRASMAAYAASKAAAVMFTKCLGLELAAIISAATSYLRVQRKPTCSGRCGRTRTEPGTSSEVRLIHIKREFRFKSWRSLLILQMPFCFWLLNRQTILRCMIYALMAALL